MININIIYNIYIKIWNFFDTYYKINKDSFDERYLNRIHIYKDNFTDYQKRFIDKLKNSSISDGYEIEIMDNIEYNRTHYNCNNIYDKILLCPDPSLKIEDLDNVATIIKSITFNSHIDGISKRCIVRMCPDVINMELGKEQMCYYESFIMFLFEAAITLSADNRLPGREYFVISDILTKMYMIKYFGDMYEIKDKIYDSLDSWKNPNYLPTENEFSDKFIELYNNKLIDAFFINYNS